MSKTLMLTATIAAAVACAGVARAQTVPATAAPATLQAPYPRTAATETQRDVDQQARIDSGLKSGALTTREAGRLERGEQAIDRTEQRALANGTLSAAERARIQQQQNAESRAIYNQKHDAQTGNPESASSRRMQADVQRNLDQQRRIHNGITRGSLTHREASRLEGGQARGDRELAAAARNGRVGPREQARVQRTDNRNSRKIFRDKHNARTRK